MEVRLEKLGIEFGDWKIRDFSASLPSGSFTSIVGPSGCGKSTLLRIIAGLEPSARGTIWFGKKDVSSLPAEGRNVGLVFQGDALFSHLNVFENVAFGPKMKKMKNIEARSLAALKIVHLFGFERRDVNSLSGGEKKRVAIARAIAFEPNLLLLDEPMNGLDAQLKEKMKVFLKELRATTGLTMVLVTHDLDEAFFLSDQIIVMDNGAIEQSGTAQEIFLSPKTGFVKSFVSDYHVSEAKKTGSGVFEGKFEVKSPKGSKRAFFAVKKTNTKFL
ncbi:MAG: ABC transporter ATP-binding protein [archaeon]|nr:ABC transporter ATP-binding protein [archaeon]